MNTSQHQAAECAAATDVEASPPASVMSGQLKNGRTGFLESYTVDEKFSEYLNAPRFAVRAVQSGLTYGYRRPGDEAIIDTLVRRYLETGKQIRCLEIGAGVTAQWGEISGNRGAPWLSRYLAKDHSDKFEIVASDIDKIDNGDHLNISWIHWREGDAAWNVKAQTGTVWKRDMSQKLYDKLREVVSSEIGCAVALPAINLGLHPRDFVPTDGASYPRFRMDTAEENLIVLPQICPQLEKTMFNLRFVEGFDISEPSGDLGQFDVIYGRHLGIGKNTLLSSIPKLAELLRPGGKIFLYTDYYFRAVLIEYANGKLTHNFPEGE